MTTQPNFLQAVKWAYAMNWGGYGFNALFTFFLAFLLTPQEFGTVALAMIYILFIQLFLEQGLVAALIQRRDLKPEHLDAVFWAVLVASTVLIGITLVFSGWWAALNNLPQLSLVISVLSIIIPIEALTVVQLAILHRKMDFRSLSLRTNISALVGGAIGLWMAMNGYSVWSIVGQRVIADLTALVLLWTLSHWRPQLRFSWSYLRDLLGFATANFVARLGEFARIYSDSLLIGILFGPGAVGLYRLAARLMSTVVNLSSQALQVASFPEFSRLQDRPTEVRRSVLSCLRISSMVSFPILAGLAVASDLLMSVLGERWATAGDVLKILCILGMTTVLTQFTGPLLQALSRPQYRALLVWLEAATGVGFIILAAVLMRDASTWGQLVGIAAARFTTSAILFGPILLSILLRHCRISLKELTATISSGLWAAGAVTLFLLLFLASGLVSSMVPILSILVAVLLAGFVAAGTLFLVDGQIRRVVLSLVYRVPASEDVATLGEEP